jgi:predicted XRE-type DNA-binding protein
LMHMTRRRTQVALQIRSRNVYADLGFANADAMLRKAKIASEISRTIKRAGYSDMEAARRLRVPHMKLSKAMRGAFERIAERTLKNWFDRLGSRALPKTKRVGSLAEFFTNSPLRNRGSK